MKALASSGLAHKTGPISSSRAHASSQIARGVIYVGALFTTLVLLGIVGFILVNGIPHLTPALFEWSYTSENVSLMPALISTLYMALLALLIAVPIGVSSAIYLVEYAKPGSRFVRVVRVTTETLQGIPSIIYGLFGMLFFTTVLAGGFLCLSGACTLAIMVLPVDHAYRRRSADRGACFLSRGWVRAGRGVSPHDLSVRAAERSAGESWAAFCWRLGAALVR